MAQGQPGQGRGWQGDKAGGLRALGPSRVSGAAGWVLGGGGLLPRPTFSPGPPLLPGWPGKPCGNKAGIEPRAQHRRQRPCPVPHVLLGAGPAPWHHPGMGVPPHR